jgi:hypothetical protein
MLYEDGDGVTKDATKAASLYKKACDGGEMLACPWAPVIALIVVPLVIALFGVVLWFAVERSRRRPVIAAKLDGEADTSVAAGDTSTRNGYFRRLWQGEVSLAMTYWVWGALAGFVAMILAAIVSETAPLLGLLLGPVMIGYYVFIVIAIWRSAGRYPGPRVWAALAKIMVVLSILRSCGEIARTLNEASGGRILQP